MKQIWKTEAVYKVYSNDNKAVHKIQDLTFIVSKRGLSESTQWKRR